MEKISGKNATGSFREESIESEKEEKCVARVNPEDFCDIYRELAELVGVTGAQKIWARYHGLTLQLPQRLLSGDYTQKFVRENMGKMKVREMAISLNLSDRRIRQIMKKLKDEEDS